jgi:uncharacterized protein
MEQINKSISEEKLKSTIIRYILVTFGFSWLAWLPFIINRQFGASLQASPIQYYIASFGPLLGAFAAAASMGGWKEIANWSKRAFSFNFAGKWILIALGLPLIYGIIAVPVHAFVTGSWPDWSTFGLTAKLPGFNIWQTALIWMLTFGLGEEAGWRGFLLPELYKRYSLIKSSLIVAAIWILWHLPAFFFNQNYMEMGFGVIGWVIGLAYGSVLLAWLCKGSNWSIIPVILWHGGFDLITASDAAGTIIAAVCSMLVIVHGIFLSRMISRNTHKKK